MQNLLEAKPYTKSTILSSRGFTLVELLVAIVVIAILAAISVIAYNGIQNRTHDSKVQSDLATIAKKFELYKVDSANDRYPAAELIDVNVSLGFNINLSTESYATDSTYNLLNCTSGATRGINYALIAKSKSGNFFTVDSTSKTVKQITTAVTLNDGSSCPTLLAGSSAWGAGWDSTNGWRKWTK